MVGLVVWLARGETLTKSGIFDFLPLMIDFTLFAMGASAVLIYEVTPFGVSLALLPVYLIYSTLRVPALERKSETDSKTGLFNAEYFQRIATTEIDRANRFDRPLTVVMADMDLLRNINNTYGHLAGTRKLIGWLRS
jgi:GGDEF domain-containing protein